MELWKRLELDRFFEQAVDHDEADVPWPRVAALLAINRLYAPGSELAIEQRWYSSPPWTILLKIEEGKNTRLYRCRLAAAQNETGAAFEGTVSRSAGLT